jgi:hypothetical protein
MSILRIGRVGVALCTVALAACGGGNNNNVTGTTASGSGGGSGAGGAGTGGTATTTSSSTGTSTFMPASHPALPQVIKFTTKVLKTPKLQPIRYTTDVNAVDLDAFFQELATSAYWGDVTAEYGVGPLTVLPTIVRTDTAPATISDDQIQTDIAANTTGTTPPWGAADPSTIYLMLMPKGTIVTQGGDKGCTAFDGYHDETAVTTAVTVPYAVGCSCHGFDGPSVTDLQERTVAISHELVEASTDPFPNSSPAYAQEDDADIVWSLDSGGELADMCEFNLDSYAIPAGSKYMIQRSWSNKAAKANTNPCVPVINTKEPYFGAAPVLPDMLTISGGGPAITTPGVKIAVGASKTIDVNLFSTAPTTGPFKLSVYDMSQVLGGPSELDLSLDKDTGSNGDTVHLTIKVVAADQQFGVGSFAIFADLDGAENLWLGTVGQ